MAISINQPQYDLTTVKIFNGGVAGAVHNCKIRFEKKAATDKEGTPDYKVILTDQAGGEVNKAYYYLPADASEARQTFFVKEMKHLANQCGATLPAEVNSYKELLDLTMKACKESSKDFTLAVFACYGTEAKPNKYLQINSAFDIVQNSVEPYINPKALLKRPTPTDTATAPPSQEWDVPGAGSDEKGDDSDLPF